MATLIPALGSCAGRMQPGERRLAERLEQKLEDDYLLWWDVPIGPKQTRPDFVVLHPRRGVFISRLRHHWRKWSNGVSLYPRNFRRSKFLRILEAQGSIYCKFDLDRFGLILCGCLILVGAEEF